MDKYRNREWLCRKYWKERLTQKEIANLCGTKCREISRWMKMYEVPTRSQKEIACGLHERGVYDHVAWPPYPPWNKGLRRIRSSPNALGNKKIGYFHHSTSNTKFKRGDRPWNWMPVGSIRIRRHEGRKERWIKIAEPNIWMCYSRYLWEQKMGRKIPRGFEIYHKDLNSLNDNMSNLLCVPKQLHLTWLRGDIKNFELRRIRGFKAYKRKQRMESLEKIKHSQEEIISTEKMIRKRWLPLIPDPIHTIRKHEVVPYMASQSVLKMDWQLRLTKILGYP